MQVRFIFVLCFFSALHGMDNDTKIIPHFQITYDQYAQGLNPNAFNRTFQAQKKVLMFSNDSDEYKSAISELHQLKEIYSPAGLVLYCCFTGQAQANKENSEKLHEKADSCLQQSIDLGNPISQSILGLKYMQDQDLLKRGIELLEQAAQPRDIWVTFDRGLDIVDSGEKIQHFSPGKYLGHFYSHTAVMKLADFYFETDREELLMKYALLTYKLTGISTYLRLAETKKNLQR